MRFKIRKLGGLENSSLLMEKCDIFRRFYSGEKEYRLKIQRLLAFYVVPYRNFVLNNKLKGINLNLFGPLDSVFNFAIKLKVLLDNIYDDNWLVFSKYFLLFYIFRAGTALLSLAPYMAELGRYIIHYTTSKNEILNIIGNDQRFQHFLNSQLKFNHEIGEFSIIDLVKLLEAPIAQIDFYQRIMQEFLDISSTDTEAECFSAALSAIDRVLEFIKNSHNLAEQQLLTDRLVSKFDNKKLLQSPSFATETSFSFLLFLLASRLFLKDGSLTLIDGNHKFQYFLFTDCLVLTKVLIVLFF